MPLSFGLYGLFRDQGVVPETLVRRARLAESAGFESLWVGDHIALPADEGGDQPRLEVVVGLSYLAAATKRIRLGLGVIVLPQRQPVLLAKQLSSLDVLSNGRLTVGLGVGYVEGELAALGATLADRGARTDEYLAAMRTLWTEPVASFSGRYVTFDRVSQLPLPVQRPHPPLVIGGHSDAALRRAVATAQGWYGVYLGVPETAELLARLRTLEAARPAGLGPLEITITPPGPVHAQTAKEYAALGVDRLVLQPTTPDGSDLEEVIRSAERDLIGKL
ncbi:LLM class F420-dependent oxidoreductase [Kribbella sp. NPDC026611]|uniref:LLM class F420-dependent oxidoreductase n=1 Tax=Kribbella sp. NPDC026611 TaxID=3154911 RepID=UPI0033E3678B